MASGNNPRALALSPIEDIIDAARNGHMFILVDDEDRENEGDLVIPAQMATPDAINFMATNGRGLICLALTAERCAQLGLDPMTASNASPLETAFTVSIEAREGVTTGISAGDRARTIAVAIAGDSTAADLVSPGHVFPLRARRGGVLVRAGHTEAAVDIARLAGLNPAGVICEIMNPDGTMARLPDLVAFAAAHNLRIATIRDLIAYRCRHDHMVERCSEADITSAWGGRWRAVGFRNRISDTTAIALVKGTPVPGQPTLVRMHALDILADAFASSQRRPADVLQRVAEAIAQEGTGVIVLIGQSSADAVKTMLGAYNGERQRPGARSLRDYGFGAQVLAALGVRDMILLSNSPGTPVALEGFGLYIVEKRPV